MSTLPRPAGRLRPAFLFVVALALAGCGRSLYDMAGEALDSCIATRNPLFVSGRGAEALDTPLPASAEALAARFQYPSASELFQEVAREAGDQVTLVCALDLASRWHSREARQFVAQYGEHPDAAVAEAARRLAALPVLY
jgi:hypothetical protein